MFSLARSHVRWEPLVLVAVMWLSVTGSVVAAGWTAGLWTLWLLVAGEMLVGVVLSLLPSLPKSFAHAFAAASAGIWSANAVLLTPTLAPGDKSGLDLLADVLRRIPDVVAANRAGVMYADNALFVLQLGLLGCLLVYLSVWWLLRYSQVWPGVLLAGGALGLNLVYAPPHLQVYLIPYLLAAGLLLVYQQTVHQARAWRLQGVTFTPGLHHSVRRHGVALVVAGVVAGWAIPLTPLPPDAYAGLLARVEAALQSGRGDLDRLTTALTYPSWRGGTYISNAMPLTGPLAADPRPLFEVRTEGPVTPRRWRAIVYDQYTGRGWINTNTAVSEIAAGDGRPMVDPWQARTVITQTVTILQAGGSAVYSAGQPIGLGLTSQAQAGRMDPVKLVGGGMVRPLDVAQLSAERVWQPGDTFTVYSTLSTASPDELRVAGSRYPGWVEDRYLQLPQALPARVQEMARAVTAGAATPYDQALALETYLRAFPYERAIPDPPAHEDLVDWFLFDLRTGYCTYYASAFVVMARSLGLPARLVVGYAQGVYVANRSVTRLRESDAHAWPEVFFPQYGWVEFEPTAYLPAALPGGPGSPSTEAPQVSGVQPDSGVLEAASTANDDLAPARQAIVSLASLPTGLGGGWLSLSMVMVVLGASGVGSALYGGRWMKGLWGLNRVERAWEQAVRLGMLLDARVDPAQTPHEMASALARVMPEAGADLDDLVAGYVLSRFSPYPLSAADLAALDTASRRVRRVALRRWVARNLKQDLRGSGGR